MNESEAFPYLCWIWVSPSQVPLSQLQLEFGKSPFQLEFGKSQLQLEFGNAQFQLELGLQ